MAEAVDLPSRASALLLALLASHGQKPVYVPGRMVNRMAGAYRSEAKTDARDAFVIAEACVPTRSSACDDGYCLGRLWAVRGEPRATGDDGFRRLDPRSGAGGQVEPQVDRRPRQFLRNKRQEWEEYRSEVTPFELRKNL
ncbi:hypothetical protein F4556_005360 [Kitasatospora gansuensis]|uniref:Transposase IS110-like N-terminal domain-containing protein n=1 Tax=Kitasatospora gansuensis TaxID=258050 RepID=A0A7W7SG38_9ACTN|nr:hypothetical protein [Kitasatospora gansuensis]